MKELRGDDRLKRSEHRGRVTPMVRLYEICVEGHLDGDWSGWLEGLAIYNQPGDGAVLRGPIVDQAALIGLLNKVHAMNLVITSVRRGQEAEASHNGGLHET